MNATLLDVPDLSHDAERLAGVWLADGRKLPPRFECLRGVNGAKLDDGRADPMLDGVRARAMDSSCTERVEDEPAKSMEVVWGFELRRRGDRWNFVSCRRGFPAYGSAPALPLDRKPWLGRWQSGPVITRDAQGDV